ncbi:hypothetical protein EVAR_38096_1 [Eumeta japonica]|uniref:Uncharacterized protein n=1 Tax=Eumeta variegata TaxID=151549 RepID=A0A4C1W8W1_EUMVA|nr:hypothetical protein EVAR_38096_1 [Eumeta japonica]
MNQLRSGEPLSDELNADRAGAAHAKKLEVRVAPERCQPSHCSPVAVDIWQPLKPSGRPPTQDNDISFEFFKIFFIQ